MRLIAVLLLFLSACSNQPVERGVDGEACVGRALQSVPGLQAASNPILQGKARFASGKGGLCKAKVFSVTAPVVLYRVYDSTRPQSMLGSWWSLNRPTGPRKTYRSRYAICAEWSRLDRLVACEVRPGTEVVVGTTQSATCADGSTYPKTGENQVYVPNDGKAGIYHVGACSTSSPWP